MRRIIIIGSGGSGKSTLAKALGLKLDIPVYHLDRLFWKPNWQATPGVDFRRKLTYIYPLESWIMDGNFGATMSERIQRADTIIFLDLSSVICLLRVLKRFYVYRNTHRPDMTVGNNERLDYDFLKWIVLYRRRSKPKVLAMLKTFGAGKEVIVLQRRVEVKDFLDRIK